MRSLRDKSPQMTFRAFLRRQVGRQDAVGAFARLLLAEPRLPPHLDPDKARELLFTRAGFGHDSQHAALTQATQEWESGAA